MVLSNSQLKGFTLAEVLITLGIIGVVAAITIPSLINGDKKPNVIGKDIYILVYEPDRGLLPAGIDKTKEEIENNCTNGYGYWCLAYLKSNGWKISDKTWKR